MARRRTFQQGTVVERKYEYGTAFILRYRIRKPDGGWQEKSETLTDCSSKKAASSHAGNCGVVVTGFRFRRFCCSYMN